MTNNIEIYRGDNKTYEVEVKDANGAVVPLTGASIKFTVKVSTKDSTPQFQLSNSDQSEIEDSDLANGKFKVHIVPANTNSMRASKYIYDIEVTLSGKVFTVIKDKFQLKADVTR